MGVASGCGEQEVGVASGSGWNLWVWLLGVVLRRYVTVHAKTLRKSAILISRYWSRPDQCSFILFSHFFAHKVRIPSYNVPAYLRSSRIARFSYNGASNTAMSISPHGYTEILLW